MAIHLEELASQSLVQVWAYFSRTSLMFFFKKNVAKPNFSCSTVLLPVSHDWLCVVISCLSCSLLLLKKLLHILQGLGPKPLPCENFPTQPSPGSRSPLLPSPTALRASDLCHSQLNCLPPFMVLATLLPSHTPPAPDCEPL